MVVFVYLRDEENNPLMYRKVIIILFCLWSFQEVYAQQLPLFTQYREHHSYINPASLSWDYFTYRYRFSIGLSHRSQWVNVEGAPNTQLLHGEYIWQTEGNFSLLTGGHLLKYDMNPVSYTGSFGRLVGFFSNDIYEGALAVGLSFGGIQYSVDTRSVTFRDANDIIATENRSRWFRDAGLGVFYYKQLHGELVEGDNIYAGISIPQLFVIDLEFDNGDDNTYQLERIRHFYANLGYYKYLNEDSFIESSIWVKYIPNVPLHADANLRFQYSNIAWIGVGYATSNSLHFEAGVLLGENLGLHNLLRIGYGYESFTSRLNRTGFGNTHEVNLSYAIDWKK